MDYKQLYLDLALILRDLKCFVHDHDFNGYALFTKDYKAFIVINPKLTYKEKYFCLAHEVGHLFYMKKNSIFNWSNKPRSEEQANWFAIQLLKRQNIDTKEYWDFYKKAETKAKKRKKSWFEID